MQKNLDAGIIKGVSVLVFAISLVFFADIFSKNTFFDQGIGVSPPRFSFFGGMVQQFSHANTGATSNIPVPLPVLLILGLGFSLWILSLLLSQPRWWTCRTSLLFTGILLGGAFGNAYDRLMLGYVRDWLLLAHRSVINVADICIIIGCIGLFATLSSSRQREKNL